MSKIAEEITARIDSALAAGIVPWTKPWIAGEGVARNLRSKKPYRGLNVLLLAISPNPGQWWVTYKQAEAMGGQVRKGEKGTRLFFWMDYCGKHKQGADKCRLQNRDCKRADHILIQKGFSVFNAETQVDGLEDKIPPRTVLERDTSGALEIGLRMIDRIETYWLPVEEGGDSAHWEPLADRIQLPPTDTFMSGLRYYQVALHELVHSTGHEGRLKRDMTGAFGSQSYAREELVAEMGSCIAAIELGFEPDIDQSASYIDGWRKAIADDSNLFTWAAGRASAAVDLLFKQEEIQS